MARVVVSRAKVEMGEFPALCARCGASEAELTHLTLPYVPSSVGQKVPREAHFAVHIPALAGIFFVFGIGVLIHGLIAGRRLALILPLCGTHQKTARRNGGPLRWAGIMLGCLTLVVTVLAFYAIFDIARRGMKLGDFGVHWIYCLAALTCAAGALLIRAKVCDAFIFLFKVTDTEVELGGVAKQFAHAVGT